MIPVVLFDRFLMGFSLFIHIILASLGITIPVVMLSAEYLGIKKKDNQYTTLARRLSVAFTVFFAVGTASGMLVAVEMFLVWPKFMALMSQVAILPFYIEVFAFFIETIFLGIYLYSWDKFKNRYLHVLAGLPLAIGSVLSGILITIINAFMNTPGNTFNVSAYVANGIVTGVHPFAVFSTPSVFIEVTHTVSSVYLAGSFIIVAFMAFMLLRTDKPKLRSYYKKGAAIALVICLLSVAASIYSGIISISTLLHIQPEKYAAIEGNLFYNMSHAYETVGGFPVNGTLQYYVRVPDLQSILAGGTPNTTVPGLYNFTRSGWPPLIVHPMFDFMLGMGFLLGFIMLVFVGMWLLKMKPLDDRLTLWVLVICGILAVMLTEDGWVMSELARQPWIIYGALTVSAAANYSTSIYPITLLILAFYALAIPLTIVVLRRIYRDRPLEEELK